jgi:hypothetical protein
MRRGSAVRPKERARTGHAAGDGGAGGETDRQTAEQWLARAGRRRFQERDPEEHLRASLAANVRHHHAIYIGRVAIGIGLMAVAVAIITLVFA